MKKVFACLAAVCVLAGAGFAAGGDPSESGIPTSPLKIWGSGVALGGFYPLSDVLKDSCGEFFGKVTWMNSFDFTENFALFLDINWYVDKDMENLKNFGVDAGGDYAFSPESRVSPFLGGGVGMHYFGKKNKNEALAGLSLTARPGVALKLTGTVEVRVMAPFHFVLSETKDMGVGVQVGAMFFSNLRNIRSIDY
ncbi:MAG: hypothetical protein LBB74_05390 [Chitinispirillales bacterium]|nr:hypothetical protein [Chitinispirillales bacterium]